MLITDAQVHVWAANSPARPWPIKNPPHLPHQGRGSFVLHELLAGMDSAGVQRALLTPPGWQGDQHHDLEFAAVKEHPDRFRIMGRVDVNAPNAREQIANTRKQPGMLGLRFGSKLPPESMDWVWAESEAAGLPLMMSAGGQLQRIEQIAKRYPKLKLIVDHFGIPSRTKDDVAFAHFDQLTNLAKLPNVATKATSLISSITDTYPYRKLHPYIRRAYDAFGPKRIFWGSDITKLQCTYRQAVTMFTEEIPWLTAEDKEWIMGRGVCEWIGWELPSSRA